MKKVIIAEKPSLAKTICDAIGGFNRYDGYFENERYIVTFAFGHLFTLYQIEDYLEVEKIQWSTERLPFIPQKFMFKLKNDDGCKEQFKIIEKLVNRDDVDTIVNCGDADREGEVIVNIIINHALKSPKKIERLWLPDQTEETIRDGLLSMKSGNSYQRLYEEGLLRTYVDWLYGINLTQLVTVKKGDLFSVGRVLIPIVEVIYKRDMEIKNFVPKKYYQPDITIVKNGREIKFSIPEKFDNREDAEKLSKYLRENKLIVKDISVKEIKKRPKKLFSLDKLQNKLSKDMKLSAQEALSIVQKLYEMGLVSYPRTNTEYLAEEEKDKVRKLIEIHSSSDCILEFKDSKGIFDSSKIESHSAITPTTKMGDNLSGISEKVYEVIKNRFIANFLKEDCIVEETNVTFEIDKHLLNLKGTVIKQEGYLRYENDLKNKPIPSFNIDETIDFNIETVEKLTQPQKHINLEELNNYLKNPFRKEETSDDEEYKMILSGVEIGTVATRGPIIEKAEKLGYIVEKKGTFYIGDKGCELMKTLDELKIDMFRKKTVELSVKLKEVYKGETKLSNALLFYEDDLKKTIYDAKNISVKKIVKEDSREIMGVCPKCGRNIYESSKSFYCDGFRDNPKCNFSLFKDNKFFEIRGSKINKTIAKNLLKNRKAKVKFTKKSGGTYTAIVHMDVSGQWPTFNIEFEGGNNSK